MKNAIESLGRIRFQGIALLVVVFLAGGVLGTVVGRAGLMRRQFFERRTPGPGMESPRFFKHLDLTTDQEQKVQEILDRYRPQTDSIMAEMTPLLRELHERARSEIMAVLTPDQRERFERFAPEGRFPMGPWMRPGPHPDSARLWRLGPKGPH